ncbi:hypothetical protein PR048_031100 [Dryococelus australis]|uniref:Uncharacterized protein n=1 Tax=Dryococelus australis TaxID=614101 RepID=A0ABQ9G8E2_9NEOP|nr:hypothetical protein PR048_031100 [Dryococelus australis]
MAVAGQSPQEHHSINIVQSSCCSYKRKERNIADAASKLISSLLVLLPEATPRYSDGRGGGPPLSLLQAARAWRGGPTTQVGLAEHTRPPLGRCRQASEASSDGVYNTGKPASFYVSEPVVDSVLGSRKLGALHSLNSCFKATPPPRSPIKSNRPTLRSVFCIACVIGSPRGMNGRQSLKTNHDNGCVQWKESFLARLRRTARLPPRRTGFNPRPGHSRISASGLRPERYALFGGFSRGSPVSPALAFRRCPISPSLAHKTSLHLKRLAGMAARKYTHTQLKGFVCLYRLSAEARGRVLRGLHSLVLQERRRLHEQSCDAVSPCRRQTRRHAGTVNSRGQVQQTKLTFDEHARATALAAGQSGVELGVNVRYGLKRGHGSPILLCRDACLLVWIPSPVDTTRLPHRRTGFDSRRGRPREYSHVGIIPDDAAGVRVFSGISRVPCPFISVLLHTNFVSPPSAPRPRMLRAAQISLLTRKKQRFPNTLQRNSRLDGPANDDAFVFTRKFHHTKYRKAIYLCDLCFATVSWAAVAERLARSPPTNANWVQSHAGENHAGRCLWSTGFLGDVPLPPPLHSAAAPYSLQSSSPLRPSHVQYFEVSQPPVYLNISADNPPHFFVYRSSIIDRPCVCGSECAI